MILKSFFVVWSAVPATLCNHVWQSTLCVVAAGLLALLLRKNHARARYWLWLAASLKFLIPFSLLVGIGAFLARHFDPRLATTHARIGDQSGFYFVMEQAGQPFARSASLSSSGALSAPSAGHPVAMLLASLWLCGLVAVLFVWCARWWRISAAMRAATPLREGREVEALLRLEGRLANASQKSRHMEIVLSPASLEPGVFGIARPVLVWPEGISGRLDDAQLESILAHEICHVLRRDNLAAAIHMIVEALFWFYPVVWWLGRRLVEERERACDEAVLGLGGRPQVYAEGILKICEFCVQSPLACVSGVTGAGLKKRIVRIMSQRVAKNLSVGTILLLAAIAAAAIGGPILFGLSSAPQLRAQTPMPLPASFESAAITPNTSGGMHGFARVQEHPGTFNAKNMNTAMLVSFAYGVKLFQVSGGPAWINTARYNITAKWDPTQGEQWQKLPRDQRDVPFRLMLQSLLADRFKLQVRHEAQVSPVYALVVAESGSKLQEAKPGDANSEQGTGGVTGGLVRSNHTTALMGWGKFSGQALTTADIANALSMQVGRVVVDETGLKGTYDITLQWTPDQKPQMGQEMPASPPAADASPALLTAIEEQLGLTLKPQTAPIDTVVIESVEEPSQN
jgi:bla regulator protein blaR1